MTDQWSKKWDERYQQEEYAYGVKPNAYLKKSLENLQPGSILFGAEGEGRNGVFAASQGWKVWAFDISEEGRKKALQLAKKNNVSIDYRVGELPDLNFKENQFDVVALIYSHLPPEVRSRYHKLINSYLKKEGILIMEVFSKRHLEYRKKNEKVGGPKDEKFLFSIEEIKSDFPDYEIIELAETEVDLNEGLYHNGKGSVIRFKGKKL